MAAPVRDIPPIEPRSWRERLPNPLEWTALLVFALSVLILVSLVLDPPNRSLRGVGGGTFLSRQPFLFLGAGVYILAALTAFWSAIIFFRNRIHNLALKAFGITLMAVSFSTLLCIGTDSRASEAYFGGYVGSLLSTALSGMSPLLSVTLVGILFLIASVFATDWFFHELIRGEAQADPDHLLDDDDALDVVTPRAHTEARVTVARAPVEAAPADRPDATPPVPAGRRSDAAATAATGGPRIMRRVLPKLGETGSRSEAPAGDAPSGPGGPGDPSGPGDPGGPGARDGGTGTEAVIADATGAGEAVAPIEATEESRVAAAGEDPPGIRFYLPDDEDTDDDDDADEGPRLFEGRIAAYELDDDDENPDEAAEDEDEIPADEEEASTPTFQPAPARGVERRPIESLDLEDEDEAGIEEETLLEAEDDDLPEPETFEDEGEVTGVPSYGDRLEEEIEEAARDARARDAAGPPRSRNVFEVIAAGDDDEDGRGEGPEAARGSRAAAGERPASEGRSADRPDDAAAPVSAAELALYESSEAEAEAEAEAEDSAGEREEDPVPEDRKDDGPEDPRTREEPEEEEVFRLDLEEEDEDEDDEITTRMVFPEALEDLPAERLAGAGASAVEPEPDAFPADAAPAAVIDEDPFADAPVTGTLFEDALPPTTRKRRVRRSAARVDRAIDDLMPSLDRMKRKIAELESEKHPGTDPSPAGAFESGEDTARA